MFALVVAPSALAANGTVLSGYGDQAGQTQGTLGGAQGQVSALPFTGVELWLVAIAGVALLITGFALKRSSAARR